MHLKEAVLFKFPSDRRESDMPLSQRPPISFPKRGAPLPPEGMEFFTKPDRTLGLRKVLLPSADRAAEVGRQAPQPGEIIPVTERSFPLVEEKFKELLPAEKRQQAAAKALSQQEARLAIKKKAETRGLAKAEIAEQKLILKKQAAEVKKQAAKEKLAEKVKVKKEAAAAKAAKPSEGLKNRYKSVGAKMVKKAEEIEGLKKLIPELDEGIFGFGGNERQIQAAERVVAVAEEELTRLQEQQDNLKVFAERKKKILDPNEWDVLQGATVQPDVNLAKKQPVKPLNEMSEDELFKVLRAGP